MNVPVLLDFNKAQLAIIRQQCAKDTNDSEFNLFIEQCKARGLNPLLKHIYAMVLHKDSKDPKKPRQLVIIVSIDGQRVIANRTGNYRPDDRAPRFEIDPDLKGKPENPAGLVSCEVAIHVHAHGGWFPVPGIAYWDEFVPLVDEWEEDPATGKGFKTGNQIIDKRKPNWRKMPRVMLAKVAEMQALRKAFPDDFSGLYGEEEMDRSHSLDLTASEILEEARREHRMAMLGGPGVMIDWLNGAPLDKVPISQLHDRACAWLQEVAGSPLTVRSWEERNRYSLRELWGYSKGDADDLKREIEKAKAVIVDGPEEAAPLSPLRMPPLKDAEPQSPSSLLRGDRKGISELAGDAPVSAGRQRTSEGVAPGKGRTPRRDPR